MRLHELPVVFFKYDKDNNKSDYDDSYENVKRELGLSGNFSDDEEYKEEIIVPTYVDLDFLTNPFIAPYVRDNNEFDYNYCTVYYGELDVRMQIKIRVSPETMVELLNK